MRRWRPHPGTAANGIVLPAAMGLGDFWWETNVDRLLTMLKFMMGEDKVKAGLAISGLHTEQMWGGSYCPLSARDRFRCTETGDGRAHCGAGYGSACRRTR